MESCCTLGVRRRHINPCPGTDRCRSGHVCLTTQPERKTSELRTAHEDPPGHLSWLPGCPFVRNHSACGPQGTRRRTRSRYAPPWFSCRPADAGQNTPSYGRPQRPTRAMPVRNCLKASSRAASRTTGTPTGLTSHDAILYFAHTTDGRPFREMGTRFRCPYGRLGAHRGRSRPSG